MRDISTDSSLPVHGAGLALLIAGLCYLPVALVDSWQGIAAIGTPRWWVVLAAATGHHVFLLFGLLGLYAVAVRRPGASALGAFVAASTGNLLVTGSGAIQLTILPALAAHPDAASALDCTPFFAPATQAAAAFVDAACSPWQFGPLEAWVGIGWLTLMLGSIWLAAELVRAAVVARTAALLLGAGWLVQLAGVAVALPEILSDAGWLAIAVGLAGCGVALLRWSPPRPPGQ